MYALETIICSAILYALYRLLLEGRIAHTAARLFLALSVVVSIVIPTLELPILPAEQVSERAFTELTFADTAEEQAAQTAAQMAIDWSELLLWLYVAITAVLAFRFACSIAHIVTLRRRCTVLKCDGYYIATSREIGEPFSFGRTIFLANNNVAAEIIIHERSHIERRHTADRLFFQAARCVMWFNPFVHLIARSDYQVCEWQADSDVINSGYNVNNYRKIIFHQLFGYSPDITCGLNSNLTKKRFIMMTKFKAGRYQWLRLAAAVPVVVGMICAFGAVAAKPEAKQPEAPEPKSVVEIRKGGEQILLNNKAVTLNQLAEQVKQSEERVVTIDADADVPMGVITDVKESLRGIENLKINYAKPEVKPVAMPIKESGAQQSTETRKIKAHNLLQVAVSADGTILLRGEKCSQSELKREVKRFIKNYHIYAMNTHHLHIGNLKNKEYSDFTTTALTMPNGERLCCPVSNGVISITSDKQTPFQTLSMALTTIDEAYNELRQDLARRVYNKPYDKLDVEYSQMIAQAIPKRVYMAEC